MCLSVFIPIPTPLPAALSSSVGSGLGASWAQAVQQLCPAPRHRGSVLALDWWKVRGAPGHRRAGPGLLAVQVLSLSPQEWWVHVGLRLVEGPLRPRGHRRSQLAQSWWQGRSVMCHGQWRAEAMLAWPQAGGRCRRCHRWPPALPPHLWPPHDPAH